MASWSANGSINSSFKLELNVKENWTNNAENYSSVHWEVKLKSTGAYSFATIGSTIVVNIDGQVYNKYSQKDLSAGGSITIASGDKNIWHNSDGSKTISCKASYTQTATAYYTPGNMSCGGNFTLTHIPRYANFTQHYASSKSINTITMYWSADKGVNAWQHSINGGAWQNCNGVNTYTISNLNPNTNYNIRTRIQASDSGLWTESGTVSITTHDIAKITEYNELLELGDNCILKYTNPSNATVKVGIFNSTGEKTIIDYKECTGSPYTLSFTRDEIDKLYRLCGESNEYVARICIQSTQNGKTYIDYKEITVKLTGKANSITIKINGIVRKGRVWIGTSAGNKAGVFVVGTSNGNRRGA